MTSVLMIGGPLDGQRREIPIDDHAYLLEATVVYRYEWSGSGTFLFASATLGPVVGPRKPEARPEGAE